MFKKRSIFTFGLCFVLFASLFFSNIILAEEGGSYDPWMDLNDDGIIDPQDLYILALIYSASGTPINKTEKLLELEARLDSLNMTLLTDYYNITECDVIFVDASGDVVTGSLDVFGNIQGETLKINQFQMGEAELNHDMYFYEDGNPLGEWISWQQIGDEFFISDDTFIWGDMEITGTLNATNLEATGDIQGETLYVDGIVMGMAEGSHAIFFYEDGMMVGEQICWDDPADSFYLSDDVNIGGNVTAYNLDVAGDTTIGGTLNASAITILTTERYYSVPGCAWQPESSDYDFQSGTYTLTNTFGPTFWYAPVNLPHGAVVTGLTAWIYDDASTDVAVELGKVLSNDPLHQYEMAEVISEGSFPGLRPFSDTTIAQYRIDNENYAYRLTALLNSGNYTHKLGNVRITYTITEPLP